MSGSLRIRVLEGRQMVPMDVSGASDPFVKVKFENEKRETKVCSKTLNPRWESEAFVFIHKSPVNTVVLEVYDHDTLGENDFMGRAEVTFGDKKMPNSGSIWVPLQPREGNTDDEAIMHKYGGLGEVKIDYSHTYFALSKYLASDHLIGQLDKKVDGRLFVKKQEGTPNLEVIERDLARLSLHARNFTTPFIWLRDHITGYKITYEDGSTEPKVVLIHEYRTTMFVAVTLIALLGYVPFWMAERLSRMALPVILLVMFRRGAGYSRGEYDEKANPFLFLQSPVVLNVFFGVDQGIFEKQFIGKAVGVVGNAFTTVGNTMTGIAQTTKNSMKFQKADSVRSSRYSFMSHQTTSDLSEEEDLVDFEYEKPTPDELKASTNDIAPYIGLTADRAAAYHQTVSWQRQHTATSLLKKAIIVFLVLLYLPTPPLAPAAWCIFTYFFFVPRLCHTNEKLYNVFRAGAVLNIITRGLEYIVRKAAGMEDEPVVDEPPAHAIKPTNKFDKGDKVEVTIEVEEDGGWKETYCEGVVVDDDGRFVVVDWGNGSPGFKIEQEYVKKVMEQETAPPFAVGEIVKVSYEKEEPNGEWNLTIATGTATRVTSEAVEIDWGDGSPTYTAPISTVQKQTELKPETDAGKMGGLVGKPVLVKIEVETENGDWVMKEEPAKLHTVEGNDAVIDWEDGDSMYRCSLDFVRGADEVEEVVEEEDENDEGIQYEPAEGHIVSVSYDMLEDGGEWTNQQATAKIIELHSDEKRVTVEWEEHQGEHYTCGVEHVKFVSETLQLQDDCATEDFTLGEKVVVKYEKEVDGEDAWVVAHDVGIVQDLSNGEATIQWPDDPSHPFTIATRNLTKLNTNFLPKSRVAFSCEAEHAPSTWATSTETGTLLTIDKDTATIDLGEDAEPGAEPYVTPVSCLVSVI